MTGKHRIGQFGVCMKVRILWVSLLMGLLLGCTQAPAGDAQGTAAAAAAAPQPEVQASTDPEAGIEDSESSPYEEGEPEDDAPTPAAFDYEPSCEEAPLATHFFTLVGGNTVDNCGRADAKVTAAFDELMKEAAQGDIADPDVPSQRERLLSGPSGPGVPKTLGRETWWFYTACQAHQCGTHQLAMLYQPEQTRLVGRLLSRCKVWWLGNPSAEQRELIDDTAPVDASLLRSDGSTCDDEA